MTSRDGLGWEFLSRAPACAACERPFAPGDEVWSRISLEKDARDDGDLKRVDACAACWKTPAEGALYWRTRVPEGKPRRDAYDAAGLFGILQRLLEEGVAGRERVCYLIALYCTRKRLLRLQGIDRSEGREHLVFRQPRTRRLFRIPSVDLTDAQLAAAQDELAKAASGAL